MEARVRGSLLRIVCTLNYIIVHMRMETRVARYIHISRNDTINHLVRMRMMAQNGGNHYT